MNNDTSIGVRGLSLLFPRGKRPEVAAIRALAEKDGSFSVSHDSEDRLRESVQALAEPAGDNQRRWVELLINGLTFDLTGVGNGPARAGPDCAYRFDIPDDLDLNGLEAVSLYPGPHLAGGERIEPVVQTMTRLAARLCSLESLVAVVWHPARSCMGPNYFTQIVSNWTKGGVFPARGFVGLGMSPDGGMQSEGAAFFVGQEVRVEPELADDQAVAAKIAARLIDFLIENGPLAKADEIVGPEARKLRIAPSANQRFVRVWGGG
ncbi:hypothetical protein MB02_04590 [Croceicoccus estronivorus]|uniref:hypothetical protein n=1 Tax=Croceicoccus estronivorus TaxID=1172626 RepID=UPI0008376C60|nr:hypothetical protein [Croceicoccus estronivorus]OCC24758.1 hypothetical protein MB02_04590 [Croceicoccus estronivorus]